MDESGGGRMSQPNRKRSNTYCIRITDYEKGYIHKEASAAGQSLTEYGIWRLVYMEQAKPLPPAGEWRELKNELTRHGTNLNQLTRAANALVKIDYKTVTLEAEVVQAAATLRIMTIGVQRELETAYRAVADAFAAGSPARR